MRSVVLLLLTFATAQVSANVFPNQCSLGVTEPGINFVEIYKVGTATALPRVLAKHLGQRDYSPASALEIISTDSNSGLAYTSIININDSAAGSQLEFFFQRMPRVNWASPEDWLAKKPLIRNLRLILARAPGAKVWQGTIIETNYDAVPLQYTAANLQESNGTISSSYRMQDGVNVTWTCRTP